LVKITRITDCPIILFRMGESLGFYQIYLETSRTVVNF